MARYNQLREGTTLIEIVCYAPGDGNLSFVAQYTQDNPDGLRGQAAPMEPTREECEAVLQARGMVEDWVLYQEGTFCRARSRTARTPSDRITQAIEVLENSNPTTCVSTALAILRGK